MVLLAMVLQDLSADARSPHSFLFPVPSPDYVCSEPRVRLWVRSQEHGDSEIPSPACHLPA